jgi:hypothetical protein
LHFSTAFRPRVTIRGETCPNSGVLVEFRAGSVVSGERTGPSGEKLDACGYGSSIWPIRCQQLCVKTIVRGPLDPAQTRKRTSQVDAIAFGNPSFRAEPGRKREGIPRVCHGSQHQRRGSAGCRSPFVAALRTGSARDPQRALGRYRGASSRGSNPPCAHRSGQPRRRLPSPGTQIFPPAPERYGQVGPGAKETCFCNVKIFSYPSGNLSPVPCSWCRRDSRAIHLG